MASKERHSFEKRVSSVEPRKTSQKGTRIRNGAIRRDFKRLLTLLASANLANTDDYAEVERIAGRHALQFDGEGNVKEIR